MARQRRKSAHVQLNALRQQAATERIKLRDLDARLAAAALDVEQQSRAIADGYAAADERAVAEARSGEDEAVANVQDLQHRVDGARLRVERAQQQRDAFERDHARDLLAEREQSARAVTLELTRSVQQTLTLARAYVAERQAVDRLVAVVPGATPRTDGPPPAHRWEAALKALERAVAESPDLEPPLPSWQGVEQRQEQDAVHRRIGLLRKRRLTPAEQAELEKLDSQRQPVAVVGETR